MIPTSASPALSEADQALRDYVDRLRSWGENDADPAYFTGDVLHGLLLDCGHASEAFATLRAERDKLRSDLAAALIQISDLAQAKGEAEGRLRASEMVGVVEGWREQNERLASELREAREALTNERRHRSMAENTAEHWRRRYDDLCNGPAETPALAPTDPLPASDEATDVSGS